MIPARDAYAYALALMDTLFTPDEMSSSLLFASKRSSKPALDHAKVEKLLGKQHKYRRSMPLYYITFLHTDLVECRYKQNYDLKILRQKCNQKCHDSKKVISGEGGV
jgi:hypothetical protein